ncbi:MAG: AmmeMemoRadiSam system protein A [Candidatus Caenarcaniphilales bacterium]|nr:AmmeMemoRadiSam system protein A [Candidatus Caenarcaniphilales bacterium]
MKALEQKMHEIMSPGIAGSFYPETLYELSSLLRSLFKQARREQGDRTSSIYRTMVAPHAGYVYSGLTAAHAYKFFQPARFKKVIVLGPAHKHSFDGVAVYPQKGYSTPLGFSPRQEIDPHLGILFSDEPFQGEHSVESHLPFIQFRLLEEGIKLEDYPVTLMVYGNINSTKLAKKIEALLDNETFLILSSDLSHYHNLEIAQEKDELAMEAFLGKNPDEVLKVEACGRLGVSAFLETKFSRRLEPEFIHYSNSAAVTGDSSRVVGYCAIGYAQVASRNQSLEDIVQLTLTSNPEQSFDLDCQKEILKTIRFCIQGYLKTKKIPNFTNIECKYPHLNQDGATFVTLTINGNLRGCIGSLLPSRPLIQDLVINGIKAACEDVRFKPLTLDEIDDIKIEVSILNSPQFVRCKNEFELLDKIEAHRHGVILQQGNKRATFLPQVWEKIGNKKDFLSQLCKKAGLKTDAWRIAKERVQIFVYTVFSFGE